MSENVTYVRGALKTMAAKRPHLSATSLKLDPGTGLAQTTRGFARRLGRRANDQTNAISKARDRSGPALYKTRSRTRPPRLHQRNNATATSTHRAAAVALATTPAKRASSYFSAPAHRHQPAPSHMRELWAASIAALRPIEP